MTNDVKAYFVFPSSCPKSKGSLENVPIFDESKKKKSEGRIDNNAEIFPYFLHGSRKGVPRTTSTPCSQRGNGPESEFAVRRGGEAGCSAGDAKREREGYAR